MRLATMWTTHVLFVLETSMWAVISLAMDADARRHPVRVARSLWRLRNSPFTKRPVVRQLFQYNQRGFHPNDRDTTNLISQWRDKLFGNEGRLSELLAS